MCVPTEIIGKSVSCKALSKKVCDKYKEGSDPSEYIPDITIIDKPCFFNGRGDSMRLECVSMTSSVTWNNCGKIKTNEVILYEEEEKKFCDDASMIFGFSFLCLWSERFNGESGSCGCVYYLSENSLE
jgi:hypothetical protein